MGSEGEQAFARAKSRARPIGESEKDRQEGMGSSERCQKRGRSPIFPLHALSGLEKGKVQGEEAKSP